MEYFFTAGDAESRHYRLTVLSAPMVTEVVHDLDFPPYTRTARRAGVDGGDVDAIEGTLVTIKAKTNQPARSGFLAFGKPGPNQETAPLSIPSEGEPNRLEGQFRVKESTSYTIQFTTTAGQLNPEPVVYHVEARKDRSPEAKIVHPQDGLKAPSNGRVPVVMEASDDFGVKEAVLHIKQPGEVVPTTRNFLENRPPTLKFKQTETIDLAALRARPQTKIEFWFSVRDTKEPQSNRAETPHLTILVEPPVAPDEAQKLEDQAKKEAQTAQAAEEAQNPPPDASEAPPPPAEAPRTSVPSPRRPTTRPSPRTASAGPTRPTARGPTTPRTTPRTATRTPPGTPRPASSPRPSVRSWRTSRTASASSGSTTRRPTPARRTTPPSRAPRPPTAGLRQRTPRTPPRTRPIPAPRTRPTPRIRLLLSRTPARPRRRAIRPGGRRARTRPISQFRAAASRPSPTPAPPTSPPPTRTRPPARTRPARPRAPEPGRLPPAGRPEHSRTRQQQYATRPPSPPTPAPSPARTKTTPGTRPETAPPPAGRPRPERGDGQGRSPLGRRHRPQERGQSRRRPSRRTATSRTRPTPTGRPTRPTPTPQARARPQARRRQARRRRQGRLGRLQDGRFRPRGTVPTPPRAAPRATARSRRTRTPSPAPSRPAPC